jgi:hypothetical protein
MRSVTRIAISASIGVHKLFAHMSGEQWQQCLESVLLSRTDSALAGSTGSRSVGNELQQLCPQHRARALGHRSDRAGLYACQLEKHVHPT